MAGDVQDIVRELLMNALEGSGKKASDAGQKKSSDGSGPLSGVKGVVAGAGAAALVPLAMKNLGNVVKNIGGLEDLAKSPGSALSDFTSKLGDSVGGGIGDKVSDKVDESGGPSGILKDSVKGVLPFGGGGDDGGGKGGVAGAGKGRRMPVQQSVDIGIPIETVYNQWTQYEDWTTFMHRVTRVTQEDQCTISFATKIWGKTKEFTAKIETQRPNERIKWKVSEGMTHTGVVTFHELGPNLTRVLVGLDVSPGSLIEKAARGMRHVKRAARGDLHRFKAFIEMAEKETGAWRGVIEDGEVVEEHDPSYDEQREYSDLEDLVNDSDEESEGEESEDEESEDEESQDEESQDDENEDEDREASEDAEEEDEQPKSKRGRSESRASSEGSGSRSRTAPRRGQDSQSKSRGRSRGAANGGGNGAGSKSSGSSSRSSGGSRSSRSKSASSGGQSGSSRSKSASSGGQSGSSRSKSASSRSRSGSSSSGRSGSSDGGSGSSGGRGSRSGASRGSSSSGSSGRTRSRNGKS